MVSMSLLVGLSCMQGVLRSLSFLIFLSFSFYIYIYIYKYFSYLFVL